MSDAKQTYARVPVTVSRTGIRSTEYTAYAGEVRGYGKTQGAAVAEATERLVTMAAHAAEFTETSVWADDQNGIWFAYPDGRGGHHAVRVHGVTVAGDARVSSTSMGHAMPADAFDTSVGMREITRHTRRKVNEMISRTGQTPESYAAKHMYD